MAMWCARAMSSIEVLGCRGAIVVAQGPFRGETKATNAVMCRCTNICIHKHAHASAHAVCKLRGHFSRMFNAPVYARSPHIASDVGPPTHAEDGLGNRLRAVLRHPGLILAVHRFDAVVAGGRCLATRFHTWLATSTMSDLRVADDHALGLQARIGEQVKPQSLVVEMLAVEAADLRIRLMETRRMARLLGGQVFAPQMEVAPSRVRIVFTQAPFAVAAMWL